MSESTDRIFVRLTLQPEMEDLATMSADIEAARKRRIDRLWFAWYVIGQIASYLGIGLILALAVYGLVAFLVDHF